MMKKITILIALCAVLFGCKSDPKELRISGDIAGLGDDTIYIYGSNELSDRRDTIPVSGSKFKYSGSIDTLTLAYIYFEDYEYPIFLDKRNKIKVKRNPNIPSQLDIRGSEFNEQLTNFNKSIAELENPSDSIIRQMAAEFIESNQTSLVNLYLLDKYFVQSPEPDMNRIKQLLDIMSGELKDKPFAEKIKKAYETYENVAPGRILPIFTLTDTKGERILRADYRNKYLLVNFWASWCDSCRTTNRELRDIYTKYQKNENLVMVGVSLDTDKSKWQEAIKQDTIKWRQTSDLSGWESQTIKSFMIPEIPYNILVDKNGNILYKGLSVAEIKQILDDLLKDPPAGR